jgi:hypothetical protein
MCRATAKTARKEDRLSAARRGGDLFLETANHGQIANHFRQGCESHVVDLLVALAKGRLYLIDDDIPLPQRNVADNTGLFCNLCKERNKPEV